MELDLEGRRALVTGGNGGIGRVISLELARRGAHVVVNGRTPEKVDAVVAEIEALGGTASGVPGDITRPEMARSVVLHAADGGVLDFGVWSGAGTTPQGALWKLFLDMSYEEFLPVIEAHWLSKAALTHAALEVMVPGGYGKIVNLCTDAGRVPTTNESMIGGAAAGVMQMFRVLARELGRYGIRLNTVSWDPSPKSTRSSGATQLSAWRRRRRVLSKLDKRRMFPVAGLDLARTVGFLLADTGDNITGQTWSVNGGLSIVG